MKNIFTKRLLAFGLSAAMALPFAPVSGLTANAADGDFYVLMNIPYEQFYAAEINDGDNTVDVVTSATSDFKTNNYSLFAGSYHVNIDSDGDGTNDKSTINGVTYPVKVPAGTDLSKYTKVDDSTTATAEWSVHGTTSSQNLEGKDCLFTEGDYAYYEYAANETPSVYKELTVESDGSLSFSKSNAEVTEGKDFECKLDTESKYGDYQLSLSGDGFSFATVLGVVVSTAERDYAMRHLENIWRGGSSIAWTTGFTLQESHGNDISCMADYYKDIMGQTIKAITVIGTDSDGNYVTVKYTADNYVAIKNGASVSVTSEKVTDADASVDVAVAGDNDGVYTVYKIDGEDVTVTDGKADISTLGLSVGSHTLSVVDSDAKYAVISTKFVINTDKVVAAYDASSKTVTAAEGVSDEEFKAFVSGISSVAISSASVEEKTYNADGKGAVTVINEDGSIDLSKTDFAETTDNELTFKVSSTGYPDLTFTYTVKEDEASPTGETPAQGGDSTGSGTGTQTPADGTQTSTTGTTEPAAGSSGGDTSQGEAETSSELSKATISVSKTTVKKGKKTVIKVTSDSGAKVTVKAANKKAKKVKIKNGKTAKITFTKKAAKGTYKFKATSPATSNYKKAAKTFKIKVK